MAIYISASTIQSYLECPKSIYYRLNHADASVQTPEMTVGNIVHKAIELYWKDRVSAENFVNVSCKADTISPSLRDRAYKSINNFFDKFVFLLSDDDVVESYFKIPMGNYFLVGRIDRITKSGTIIDWKTSPRLPKSINSNIQFTLYHYAYSKLYNRPPTSVIYASLTTGQMLLLKHDTVLEYGIINEIIPTIIESVQNNRLPALGLHTGQCKRCPFENICHEELGYVVDRPAFINGYS